MPVTPEGYQRDADSRMTGGLVQNAPRQEELGVGRGTPEKRQLPYARHMGINVIIGEGSTSTDSVGAKNDALAAWDTWKQEAGNERLRVLEVRFDFVTEGKMALYIIYSE